MGLRSKSLSTDLSSSKDPTQLNAKLIYETIATRKVAYYSVPLCQRAVFKNDPGKT